MGTLLLANGIASLGGVIFLGYIVLNERIKEGVVIKLGLVLMIFALAATATYSLLETGNWAALWAAGFTLRLGLLVVGLGFWIRRWQRGSWDAAMSDWASLTPQERKH